MAKIFKFGRKNLRLRDLTQKDQNLLLALAEKSVTTSVGDKKRVIKHEEQEFVCDSIIRYLNSVARFQTNNHISVFSVNQSSIKLVKSSSNVTITKLFCDIVKNTAKNLVLKNDFYKMIAEKSIYLVILDKKRSTSIDFIMMNSIARLPISSFHFVHAYKARIAEKKV
jgi:hypothetical protein